VRTNGKGLRGDLGHQPRVADPRLPDDCDHASVACARLGEEIAKAPHLLRSPDERSRGRSDYGRRRESGRRTGVRSGFAAGFSAWLLSQDLLIEPSRVGLGLHPELAPEYADADLVLAKGRSAPSLLRVEPHQGAIHGLLQRIERDQPQRRLQRGVSSPRGPLTCQQLREGAERQFAQPLPLGHQPVLEMSATEREALEEITAIQADRLLECFRVSNLHEPLEGGDIDVDRVDVQGNRFAGEVQAGRVGGRQGAAKDEERLAETAPGLVL